MSMLRRLASGAAAVIATVLPGAALAATAAGGGMPYSTGLGTFKTSVTGEIAGILIVIAVVGGVALWIGGGQLDGMLHHIAKVIIGACIVGGVVAFLAAIGVSGAII